MTSFLYTKTPQFIGVFFLCFCFQFVSAQSKMSFDKKTFKFPKTNAGEQLTFKYPFTNTGKDPLIITKLKVTCDCTTFEFPKAPILPANSDTIYVYFETSKAIGFQDREIEIYNNSPNSVEKIKFKGVVNHKK